MADGQQSEVTHDDDPFGETHPRVTVKDGTDLVDEEGGFVATTRRVRGTKATVEERRRARRLAASWNGCDAFRTDQLEGFSPRFLATYPDRVLAERKKREARITELENLLSMALPYVEDAKGSPLFKPGVVAKLERDIRNALNTGVGAHG